ncbi:hypothetical protein NDU88_004489 [Pleurodeles waltl]|uniref:Uncharacterized protein n=1 Tax=Pleurodeles waltl TaxID=8319 RepID=A0AAV7UID2_PLEWA|nr:hypothetical protein NDU88_004489 [Pleurodeles waltl]
MGSRLTMLRAPLQPKRRPEPCRRHRPCAVLSSSVAHPPRVSSPGRHQQPCELRHDFPLLPWRRNRGPPAPR